MTQQMRPVKYMNLNPFPVCLPDGRGGQVMFRPGEGTTKPWFCRLCGPRQLTKIDPNASSTPAPTLAPSKKVAPVVAEVKLPEGIKVPEPKKAPIQNIPVTKPVAHDVETADYTFRRGIYKCKKCDVFMTGSNEALQMHIAQIHMQKPKTTVATKFGQGDGEGERTVASTKGATVRRSSEDEDKEEVRTSLPRPPAEKKVAQPARPTVAEKPTEAPKSAGEKAGEAVFPCQHPGCGKVFGSDRGLKMHTMRVHK
jgi:hypothetical protein